MFLNIFFDDEVDGWLVQKDEWNEDLIAWYPSYLNHEGSWVKEPPTVGQFLTLGLVWSSVCDAAEALTLALANESPA